MFVEVIEEDAWDSSACTKCKRLYFSVRYVNARTSEIRYYPRNAVRVHFFVAFRFHGRAAYINILSRVGKRWRTLWAYGRTGGFISDPSIPDVTPSARCRYRESRASLARLDFLCLVKQTTMTDSAGRAARHCTQGGRGYRVISLSRPCLGDNYRRTAPRDVFPRFSADWQNVSSAMSPLMATRGKYTRSCLCQAELCNN